MNPIILFVVLILFVAILVAISEIERLKSDMSKRDKLIAFVLDSLWNAANDPNHSHAIASAAMNTLDDMLDD